MARFTILFFSLFIFQISTNAQGTVSLNASTAIENMMAQYVENNKAVEMMDGWRIQLLATTDRQKVESAKQRFQVLYPNIFVDWTHASPFYKLRAGAFATKKEAIRMLYVLRRDYPNAYTARDNTIRPSELVY